MAEIQQITLRETTAIVASQTANISRLNQRLRRKRTEYETATF